MTTCVKAKLPLRICTAQAVAAPFLGMLLALTGCSSFISGPGSGAPPPPQPTVTATLSFCEPSACTPASAFQISSLVDLAISVTWSHLPAGDHLQTLLILTPDGSLYQKFEVNFAVVEGSQNPVVLQQVLPIKGSFISLRGIAGDWKVEVVLDESQPMTATSVRLDL